MKKLLLFTFICIISFAKAQSIKGKITKNGKPIGFVSIYSEKSLKGTSSDKKGIYSFSINSGSHIIVASAIGFKTKKVKITLKENENKTINFELEDDILGLDQVVVSATRRHLNRKIAPVIVTVTDSKLLEATQSLSLSEGLNFQPGLRLETNCQNCGYSQVRINGLEGSYSQILVDGRPVFSSLTGVYGLDQIPTNIISRIEVVKGGGSALYGANAIAGTINVITKDPKENSFQIGGNFASVAGKSEDISSTINGTIVTEDLEAGASFFGMYRTRNPYDHNGDSFTEITKLKSKSFGIKTFYTPNDLSRITVEFSSLNEFRRGGNKLNSLPFQSDITEQIDSDVILGGITYETSNKTKNNLYSLYASGSLSENKNYYGGNGDLDNITNINQISEKLSFGNSKDDIGVIGAQYTHKFGGSISDVFTGGVEFKYNETKDIKKAAAINIHQVLRTYGVYSQYEWIPNKKIKILAGLRADFHNLLKDEKVVFNPRLNVMYSHNENFRIRSSYAKGFRAPQFFTDDLHVQIAAGELHKVQLAKNLVSETSHSFTSSLDWSKNYTSGSQIGFTLEPFYTILKNPFILEDTSNDSIKEKSNGDNAIVKGINLEFKYSPNKQFFFQIGGTVQKGAYKNEVALGTNKDGKDIKSDKFLRSPNLYGNFVLTYAPIKRFQNNLSGVFTGSMYLNHITGTRIAGTEEVEVNKLEKTNNFFELNWKSSYNFSLDNHNHLRLQVNGGIQNIFESYQNDFDKGTDRDAAYVYGPSRPRTFFIGLKIGTNL